MKINVRIVSFAIPLSNFSCIVNYIIVIPQFIVKAVCCRSHPHLHYLLLLCQVHLCRFQLHCLKETLQYFYLLFKFISNYLIAIIDT